MMPCLALALSGCGSTSSYRTTRRGPVWVVPATAAASPTASSAPVAATNNPPPAETNQAPVSLATARAPALQTNAPPPVANVLSVAEIKEMAGKGVSEQTILNVLRASRAIYTLTTQDVIELQEAKVGRAVTDYLLSTPLLYKDDLLRPRAYYYSPSYPGYWPRLYYDFHHDVHHFDSHHSYGHGSYHDNSHH